MKNNVIGQSAAGNPIKTVGGENYIFVGNDGFEMSDEGKFTIQFCGDTQWNEIENGRVETETEAAQTVQDLIAGGFCEAEQIRYTQI